MTVYVDAVFILNLFFDGIILILTGYIAKQNLSLSRLILGAIFCASSVFITLSQYSGLVSSPLGKFIYSICIILIAFYPRNIQSWLLTFFTFYVVTFTLGGTVIGLNLFFHQSIEYENGALITTNGGYGDPITWLFVLIAFPCAAFVYKKHLNLMKSRDLKNQSYYQCIIQFNWFVIECRALLDTGNHLVDPLSGIPVVILDANTCRTQIPEDLLNFIMASSPIQEVGISSIWEKYKMTLLPYKSLGNENGLIYCIKPLNLIARNNSTEIQTDRVLVALTVQKLSPSQEFMCILNPEIFIDKIEIADCRRGLGEELVK